MASLTALKYAVLAVAYAFLYLTARRVLAEPRLPGLAAFSLLLLLPIGWFVHDDLTQSVAVLAAAAATVHALIRLEAAPTPARYAGLGVALALGTLSKLTYLVFGAALALAALTIAPYRRRLLDPRAIVTVLVAAALLLPYGLWLATHQDDLLRFAQQVSPGATPLLRRRGPRGTRRRAPDLSHTTRRRWRSASFLCSRRSIARAPPDRGPRRPRASSSSAPSWPAWASSWAELS